MSETEDSRATNEGAAFVAERFARIREAVGRIVVGQEEALRQTFVTLLVGGLDRGLDWSAHRAAFRQWAPHAIIGIPDSGPHILSMLSAGPEGDRLQAKGGLHRAEDLAQAVKLASDITPEGGIVLLSPGAPSFPVFRDYAERAAAFAKAAGLQ